MTFRQVKSSEVDKVYALYLSVFKWLNGQGIRQWLVPLSLDIFIDRQRSGKLFAQFVEDYLSAIVTIAYEQSRYWIELIGQDQSCLIRSFGSGAFGLLMLVVIGDQWISAMKDINRKSGGSRLMIFSLMIERENLSVRLERLCTGMARTLRSRRFAPLYRI